MRPRAYCFIGRSWLLRIEEESCLNQRIQPVAQGAVEARCPKPRQPCLNFQRRGFTESFGRFTTKLPEIISDFDSVRDPRGVAKVATVRRVEAWVRNRKLQESIRLEDAVDLSQYLVYFGNVHQTHERTCEIESGVSEWRSYCVGDAVPDRRAQWRCGRSG